MSDRLVLTNELNYDNIADAIREKNGSSATYRPGDMAAAIRDIDTDPVLESLTAAENDTYTPGAGVDGFDRVTVAVPTFQASVTNDAIVLTGPLVSATQDAIVIGTPGGAMLVPKTITQNGTYDPADDNADGYSGVTVNVPGGGPSWFHYGVDAPAAALGSDGDVYYQAGAADIVPIHSSYDSGHDIAGQNQSTAYKVYDDDGTTFWTTQDRNYNDMWVGYDLGEGNSAVCTGVSINPRSWNNVVQLADFKVQASNDLSTWVDLYEGNIPNNASQYAGVWNDFSFSNAVAYRAYRLLALSMNSSITFTIFGLRFTRTASFDTTQPVAFYIKQSGAWVRQW